MEPQYKDDLWKQEELEKLRKKNSKIAWVLIGCMLIWAFFMNGQMMFYEFSGKLGFIPQEEVQYLIENMEYYYLYENTFDDENYQALKESIMDKSWVRVSEFEELVIHISDLAGDEYSYFYYDSFLNFRGDYSYLTENMTDHFESSVTKDGIGLIHFTEFIEDTSVRFIEAIDSFKAKGVDELIIDLRDNPGGLLVESNKIVDSLLPKVEIVSQIFNDSSIYSYYSDPEMISFDKIYILLDSNSASCSEMVALSLKENLGDKVKLIGHKTVGKEVTQNVFDSDVFHYMLFVVASRWAVNNKTTKDLNHYLEDYKDVELKDFEDYYQYIDLN